MVLVDVNGSVAFIVPFFFASFLLCFLIIIVETREGEQMNKCGINNGTNNGRRTKAGGGGGKQ